MKTRLHLVELKFYDYLCAWILCHLILKLNNMAWNLIFLIYQYSLFSSLKLIISCTICTPDTYYKKSNVVLIHQILKRSIYFGNVVLLGISCLIKIDRCKTFYVEDVPSLPCT